MAAVFDGPMVAVEFEHAGRGCGVGAMAGHAVGDFHGGFAGFLVHDAALDGEGLSDAGEVEIVVQCTRGPDGAAFEAAMRERVLLAEVRLSALLEGQLEIGQQRWLIAFDGEQVVRLAIDDVASQLALGQQGIGGEGFAGNLQRLEQRDEGADFVGLLGLVVAGYGQRADFFWVKAVWD